MRAVIQSSCVVVFLTTLAFVARANETNTSAVRHVFDFVDAGGNRPAVVSGVALSGNGQWLAAAGGDHTVRLYDTRTLSLAHKLTEHKDWVRGVAFSPLGDRLISVGNDHTHCVFCPSDGSTVATKRGGEGPLRGVAFSPAADKFATVGFHTPACICAGNDGTIARELECPCRDTSAVTISPDGKLLAVAGRNGIVRIARVDGTGEPIDIKADSRRIRALRFSPNGTRLAVGGDGPEVKFFDPSTGRLITSWPTRPAKVFCLLYLDDEHLAIGGSDNTIHIWNAVSGTVERQLAGHTGTITSLACDSTGKLLASGSYDTTVRLWDLEAKNNLASHESGAVR